MKNLKMNIRIFGLLLALIGCQQAFAGMTCTPVGGVYSVSGAVKLEQGIGSSSLPIVSSPVYQMICYHTTAGEASGVTYLNLTSSSAPVSGYTNVYPTSLSGVGVRYNFSSDDPLCNIPSGMQMSGTAISITCQMGGDIVSSNRHAYLIKSSVELVRIPGTLTAGQVLTIPTIKTAFRHGDTGSSWPQSNFFSGSANINLAAVTCNVGTNPMNVVLPTITTKELLGVGSTAGQTGFQLLFNCESSMAAEVTVTSSRNSNVFSGPLGVFNSFLSGAGASSGVSIQLLKGDQPVVVDQSMALGQGTTFNLDLSARYYRTGDLVPGRIETNVVYTVNYK